MPANPPYRSRAVRALVLLHDEHLRRFVQTWRRAIEASITLPPTQDPAYASLGTLGRHVLSASGGYLIWVCQMLTLPDPEIRPVPDAAILLNGADDYLDHLLERWETGPLWQIADDQMETPEYPSEWQTRYSIDSMLEHAVIHPIRHTFQLEELMRNRQ